MCVLLGDFEILLLLDLQFMTEVPSPVIEYDYETKG